MTVHFNIGLGTQTHHNISGSFYILLKYTKLTYTDFFFQQLKN